MTIYLVDLQTQEIKETFENVIRWSANFVEYNNNGRGKRYCDENTEYFTDKLEHTPEQFNEELEQQSVTEINVQITAE